MSDPILKAAADLKKEAADVPELAEAMNEIMKLLLGAVPGDGLKKS